jgi:FKBP-type peptidyl-prolyl cis-trans isomerase FklB
MKRTALHLSTTLALLAGTAAAQTAPESFQTPMAATGYAVGVDMVRNFKNQNVPFDLEQLVHGLKDAAGGGKLLLSDAEVRRLVGELETEVRVKLIAARKAEGEANQKKSEDFLRANAAKPGVVSLTSGLQYLVLKAGTGAKPADDASVLANYSGTLADGTVFDASPDGKPAAFKVNGVIPGWREALKLMPAGSTWRLVVPPKLAYGERGAGRVIGPNQVLQFKVELVEVK